MQTESLAAGAMLGSPDAGSGHLGLQWRCFFKRRSKPPGVVLCFLPFSLKFSLVFGYEALYLRLHTLFTTSHC